MDKKLYYRTVSTVFVLVALLHGLRIVQGWEAEIGDVVIPMWVSWVAVALALYLAYRGHVFAKKSR